MNGIVVYGQHLADKPQLKRRGKIPDYERKGCLIFYVAVFSVAPIEIESGNSDHQACRSFAVNVWTVLN
jgi:hypothetical protein